MSGVTGVGVGMVGQAQGQQKQEQGHMPAQGTTRKPAPMPMEQAVHDFQTGPPATQQGASSPSCRQAEAVSIMWEESMEWM